MCAALSCDTPPRNLRWQISFGSDELSARATVVEARILEGGCDSGAVVFTTDITRDTGAIDGVPELRPGAYGYSGRARDGDCKIFANGCVEVQLPTEASEVEIVMGAAEDEQDLCSGAQTCEGGVCVTPTLCGDDVMCPMCSTCGEDGQCIVDADGSECASGRCYEGNCCEGCWDGAQCAAGTSNDVCGANGDSCVRCACESSTCVDGSCTPTMVVSQLGLGGFTSCAILESGQLWCWGANEEGQLGLGNGSPNTVNVPTQVGTDLWLDHSQGEDNGCAVRQDNTLWCWGNNEDGQLGVGDTTARNAPTAEASGATDWVQVEAATTGNHACGIRSDNSLHCWGGNNRGQLGVGDTADRNVPTALSAGTWSQVSLGDEHSCGVRPDGTLWCWGSNEDGQLGQGDVVDLNAPTQVGTDTNWGSVSAGFAHTCGLRTDGTLWCWGDNNSGALGTDDRIDHMSPVQVGADTWRLVVSTGNRYNCAVRSDGTLWCWGRNFRGALGTGDMADRGAPTQVGASTDWAGVDLGRDHTCGLKPNGTIECFGRNFFGSLGTGDFNDRLGPQVLCFPNAGS